MATTSVTTRAASSLKRKHDEDEDEDGDLPQQPRKFAARPGPSNSKPPLRPNKQANNLGRGANGPPALTQPRAPSFSKPRSTRANSAPPSKGAVPPPSANGNARSTAARPAARPAPGTRTAGGRVPSSSFTPTLPGVEEDRLQQLQNELTGLSSRVNADMDIEKAKVAQLQESQLVLSRELANAKSQELTRRKELDSASDALDQLKRQHAQETMDLELDLRRKDRECRELKEDVREARESLEAERERTTTLKATVSQMSTTHLMAESQKGALQAQLNTVQAAYDAERAATSQLRLDLETMQKKVDSLEVERLEHEGIRRKLHNIIQELKGNIRVFCRVRPILPSDLPDSFASASSVEERKRLKEEALAPIEFPDQRDHKEIVLSGASESATGQERKEMWNFNFDRVFEPESTQGEVFEEVSQLAQSVTDGYNVCIFAYGQTGSGKSFTMEGGITESSMGMIPRAVDQVFRVAEDLRSKGWEYRMEGQFLEIYNETVNDLLGHGELDKKKHEIKHDKSGTRVTDVNVIPLGSALQVRTLLSLAQSRRTVAATLMNERSSRSHSVFTLRVFGANVLTGESCEGALNLVDLAGSERLNASGAGSDKDRLRETQNINRSLSALGDVIAALGEKGEKSDKHIPYRNSKLTYLLQNSLSGNSKTLMILNVSPLASSLGESLCSLRFATKVNNTTIGTAKKQVKSSPA